VYLHCTTMTWKTDAIRAQRAAILSTSPLAMRQGASPCALQVVRRGPAQFAVGRFLPTNVQLIHTVVGIIFGSPCQKVAAAAGNSHGLSKILHVLDMKDFKNLPWLFDPFYCDALA
jgi:hypothetical protein